MDDEHYNTTVVVTIQNNLAPHKNIRVRSLVISFSRELKRCKMHKLLLCNTCLQPNFNAKLIFYHISDVLSSTWPSSSTCLVCICFVGVHLTHVLLHVWRNQEIPVVKKKTFLRYRKEDIANSVNIKRKRTIVWDTPTNMNSCTHIRTHTWTHLRMRGFVYINYVSFYNS